MVARMKPLKSGSSIDINLGEQYTLTMSYEQTLSASGSTIDTFSVVSDGVVEISGVSNTNNIGSYTITANSAGCSCITLSMEGVGSSSIKTVDKLTVYVKEVC